MGATALSDCRLYGILDLSYVEPSEVRRVAAQMIDGGVELIQLRAKNMAPAQTAKIATELLAIMQDRNVPLIINDHPDLLAALPAQGVHVGQDDVSIARAREMAGRDCVVGKSTHSLEQAIRAAGEGADYIGFGPLFATPTKPGYSPVGLEEIEQVHDAVSIPIFCIGGIKLDNLPEVIAAGARRVVIVSGLLLANDIASYARSLKELLES